MQDAITREDTEGMSDTSAHCDHDGTTAVRQTNRACGTKRIPTGYAIYKKKSVRACRMRRKTERTCRRRKKSARAFHTKRTITKAIKMKKKTTRSH